VRAYTLTSNVSKNRSFLGFLNPKFLVSGFWYFYGFEGVVIWKNSLEILPPPCQKKTI